LAINNGYLPDQVPTQIRFSKNQNCNTDGGRSTWISTYLGVIIFPSNILDKLITEGNLQGKCLQVVLELRENLGNENKRYVAHPDRDQSLIVAEELVELKRSVVVIDGQNFLYSLRKVGVNLSPLAVILQILENQSVDHIRFYICREAAIKKGIITEVQMREIEQSPQITIVSRQAKIIRTEDPLQPDVMKVDVDQYLMVDIAEVTFSPGFDDIEVIILFSGDSDFHYAVQRWLNSKPSRQVRIVSSQDNLSTELRELCNKARADFITIKDIFLPI